jgi:hypothetical protein
MVKRYSGPTPGNTVAALLRQRGIIADPWRSEEGAAALRSRQKVEEAAHFEQVEAVAIAATKARRACELAEFDRRRNPNADTLAAAMAAQKVRNAADAELRELLCMTSS